MWFGGLHFLLLWVAVSFDIGLPFQKIKKRERKKNKMEVEVQRVGEVLCTTQRVVTRKTANFCNKTTISLTTSHYNLLFAFLFTVKRAPHTLFFLFPVRSEDTHTRALRDIVTLSAWPSLVDEQYPDDDGKEKIPPRKFFNIRRPSPTPKGIN